VITVRGTAFEKAATSGGSASIEPASGAGDPGLSSFVGAEIAASERDLTLPPDCMALEIDRLRLTPDRPGTYRLALALRPSDGEAIENGYDIIVV